MLQAVTRKNQSRKVTARKFNEFMHQMCEQDKLVLPSERELCKLLTCSRNNLRQVLEDCRQSGDIEKKDKGRALSMKKVTGKKILGHFAFVAQGENMVSNPAWNKLWSQLQNTAKSVNLSFEIFMISYHCDPNVELERIINGPEVIVLAGTPRHKLTEQILNLPEKKVILLDEQHASVETSLITLDNYRAGYMAAQQIHNHGYHRPAWISHDVQVDGKLYKMFAERLRGFRQGCKKCNLEFDTNSEFLIEGNSMQFIIRLLKWAQAFREQNFDSVFVYTDNVMPLFYQALLEEGIKVPGDIGIITVNSFDNAISNHPRISSVSNATHAVVDKLVEELCCLFKSNKYKVGQFFMKPSLHQGETL